MESLGLGDAEALRASAKLAAGYPRLDPTLPAQGKHNRRWGLLINVKVGE
jgi:predicted transcriptional regulator of viral defense system